MKTLSAVLLFAVVSCSLLSAGPNKGKDSGQVAAISGFPNPLGFGKTEVGQISRIEKVTYYNVGNVPIELTYFQMPLDYQILQNTCVADVPVRGSCDIYLVFKPTRTGNIGEYLIIHGNMMGPYYQALAGTAYR